MTNLLYRGVDAGVQPRLLGRRQPNIMLLEQQQRQQPAARIGGVTCVLLLLHNTFHNVQNSANTDQLEIRGNTVLTSVIIKSFPLSKKSACLSIKNCI